MRCGLTRVANRQGEVRSLTGGMLLVKLYVSRPDGPRMVVGITVSGDTATRWSVARRSRADGFSVYYPYPCGVSNALLHFCGPPYFVRGLNIVRTRTIGAEAEE